MDLLNRPNSDARRYKIFFGRVSAKPFAFIITTIATVLCLLCLVCIDHFELNKYEKYETLLERKYARDPIESLLDPNSSKKIEPNETIEYITRKEHSLQGDTAFLAVIIFGFLCIVQLFVSILTIVALLLENQWVLVPQLLVQGAITITSVVLSVTLLLTILNTPIDDRFFTQLILLLFVFQCTFTFECIFFAATFKSFVLFRDINLWKKRQRLMNEINIALDSQNRHVYDNTVFQEELEDLEALQQEDETQETSLSLASERTDTVPLPTNEQREDTVEMKHRPSINCDLASIGPPLTRIE